DVADPADINSLGYLFLPGEATGISMVGPYCAIACDDSTLQILDPSDPADITVVGTFASDAGIYRCYAVGDTVYTNGDKFTIIDASTPSAPSAVGEFTIVAAALGLCVSPPYAYLAEKSYGLNVVDIADPSSPAMFDRYLMMDAYVRGVNIDRYGKIYLATDDGLYIYEHSGDSLRQLGFWASPDYAYDVVIDGIYAFIACGNAGLRVVDVSTPSAMTEVGYYNLGSEITDIFLEFPIAWGVGLWARVNAFDVSMFAPVAESQAKPAEFDIGIYPNPFNSAVKIRVLGLGSWVSAIEIFDISGRKIAEFPVGAYGIRHCIAAGSHDACRMTHDVLWTPGAEIPSGIYLIRIKGETQCAVRKAILLR
ncbi:MAG: hypothetical protein DRP16_05820, partial [Candidatus Aenigmatarchaeota archaeon]